MTESIRQQASKALDELIKYLESKGIKQTDEDDYNIISKQQNDEQSQDPNFDYGDYSDTKCDCEYWTINERIENTIADYIADKQFKSISQDDADKIETLTRVQAMRLQSGIEDLENEVVHRVIK